MRLVRYIANLIYRFLIIFWFAFPQPLFAQAPLLNSFSPLSGGQSTQVIISGNNFTGAFAVSFGGTNAAFFIVNSSTQITAIPGSGSTGSVSVTTPSGSASLPGFTFTGPLITSFSPTTAPQGTTVTINGSNFTGAIAVAFGGIAAISFTVLSDISISAVVGAGTSGQVLVATPLGTATVTGFIYSGPIITSFSPTFAAPVSTITINGQNFTGATAVDFGGLPASSFTVIDDFTITAVNGIGYSGPVTVSGPTGSGSRSGFVMLPSISSFTPMSGPTGTAITINGLNFNGNPSSNNVALGAVRGTVTAASPTSLTVTVPAGTTYRPIAVTANSFVAYATHPFIQTFTGGGGPLYPSSFAMLQVIPGGGDNNFPVIADLNNDGKADIITTNPSNGNFSVFKNTSNAGVASFATEIHFTTGLSPIMSACDDLSSDGKKDVVVTNSSSNTISVFPNNSSGSTIAFFPKLDFSTGSNPRAVAIKDIDGDGKPDIVVANNSSNSISIFRNTTPTNQTYPLTFAAKVDFTTGTAPTGICINDIDGDGKAEIAVTNSGSATISVFRNTSSTGVISLDPKVDFVTGSNPKQMVCGDIDGDGKVDIIVGNTSSSSLSILRNSSSVGVISFDPKIDFATRPNPSALSIGDINGDGKPDLAFLEQTPVCFSVLKNISTPGTMSMDTRQDYSIETSMNGIAAGDINLDGKYDIVLGSSFSPLLYRNKIAEAPIFTSFSPTTAVIGDSLFIYGKNLTGLTSIKVGGIFLDSIKVLSDTTAAIILETETGGTVEVINQWGSASLPGLSITPLPKITSFAPTSGPVGTIVTINGSNFNSSPTGNIVFFGAVRAQVLTAGTSEITVAVPKGTSYQPISLIANHLTACTSKPFSVTFPGAQSAFNPNSFAVKIDSVFGRDGNGFGPVGIALSDVDGDGKADVNVSGHYPGLAIWRNLSDSGVIALAPKKIYNSSNSTYDLDINDYNRDGKKDITVGTENYLIPGLVYKNISVPGNISLASGVPLSQSRIDGFIPRSADMDNDGKPDIVLSTQYLGDLSIYRNISTMDSIRFGARVTFNLSGPRFCLSDIDGDGRLDFCGYGDLYLYVNLNLSTPGYLRFGPRIQFFLSGVVSSVINVVAADLDGDDKPDIVASRSDHTLRIFRNISTPGIVSFAAPVIDSVTNNYSNATVGDIDGDGKVEIICAEDALSKVAVFKNTCTPGNISFQPKKEYAVSGVRNIAVGDIDYDGKPDIAVSDVFGSLISFLRNKTGEPASVQLCPPIASATLTSDLQGNTYQWQVDTGTGFANIFNDANYSGVNTINLQLTAITAAWNGYKYRCVVDADTSMFITLRFTNYWLGTVSNAWENPANWSCGVAPDSNTDVVIAAGSVIVLNSNTTIRTLTVRPGVNFTVNPGYLLTITH